MTETPSTVQSVLRTPSPNRSSLSLDERRDLPLSASPHTCRQAARLAGQIQFIPIRAWNLHLQRTFQARNERFPPVRTSFGWPPRQHISVSCTHSRGSSANIRYCTVLDRGSRSRKRPESREISYYWILLCNCNCRASDGVLSILIDSSQPPPYPTTVLPYDYTSEH